MFSCFPQTSHSDIADAWGGRCKGVVFVRFTGTSGTSLTAGHTPPADSIRPPRTKGAVVQEFERKQLLERIEREGATVGAEIPDEISVQGERIDLQSFVFEIKRRDTVPRGERERVTQAKKNLRRERLARKQRLEDDDL